MLTVGSSLSSALVALNALTPGHVQADVASPKMVEAGNALTGVSRMRLSSSAADALLKFSDHASTAKSGSVSAPATISIAAARAERPVAHPSGIPADKVAWLDSLGADSWSVREPPRLGEAQFKQQVFNGLVRNGSIKLEGFGEALEGGTLKIQRAAELPELGYKSFQVTLFKDGKECGGAGFSVCNTDHWMKMRENGIYAGTGSVEGNDYVVTWPMARQGGETAVARNTYAAA